MTELDDRTYRAQFYRAVDQRQGTDERQKEFYVPIYDRPELAEQDVVQILFDGIEFSLGQSVQMLSGFRGSGKTSELLRLQERLLVEGYSCVYFDIEDYFNTELPVELGTFALGLAAGFADGCGHVADAGSMRERLTGMLKRLKIEPTVSLAAGPVGVDLKAALRDDVTFRTRLTEVMRSNRRIFREELHTFFSEAAKQLETGRTVFIVDSIDHFRGRTDLFQEVRESVERLFSELADDLSLPGMHVIYTVPIYVQPPIGTRRDLLNIKVMNADRTLNEPGRDALVDVLRKRAPGGDIERLLGPHVDRLVADSGGLIRDFLRLTADALLRVRNLPADEAVLLLAEQTVRAQMETALSEEQVTILREVRDTRRLTPSREEWPDAYDLMSRGAILCYPNGERSWFGVHPLLDSLL